MMGILYPPEETGKTTKAFQAKQVWPLVVHDMLLRNEEGAEKYNRYLRTDCPDNMLQHAYEESLDLCVYLKTCIEQNKGKE